MGDERAQAASAEIIWAAGFWDGEGSCGCYVKNDGRARIASGWTLRAHIFQNRREPLDRFVQAVGVGKVYGPYRQETKPNEHFNYQCTGAASKTLFELLLPWVCAPKREQILAALEKFGQRPEPRVQQGLGGSQPCPPGCTCKRHRSWQEPDESLTPQQLHRREKMREYQARHREKLKNA